MPDRTVFVLGAGFTKAFLPDAPLMLADYDADGVLSKKFEHIPYAKRLLELEKSAEGGLINIERLMSRLNAGMPYDVDRASRSELELLFYEVKEAFFRQLKSAVANQPYQEELLDFANYCIQHKIQCITFNYDDLFDWALANAVPAARRTYTGPPGNMPNGGWHPDYGYGFPCTCKSKFPGFVPVPRNIAANPEVALLKLHGSVNWRIQIGYQAPYNPDAIVHYESWDLLGDPTKQWAGPEDPAEGTERDPFFVPPVLIKSAIVQEPILRIVWSKAYHVLEQAKRIVFLGYSLPVTDMASRFLFTEAIPNDATVEAVVKPSKENPVHSEESLRSNYAGVFGATRTQFHPEDAREWAACLVREG